MACVTLARLARVGVRRGSWAARLRDGEFPCRDHRLENLTMLVIPRGRSPRLTFLVETPTSPSLLLVIGTNEEESLGSSAPPG